MCKKYFLGLDHGGTVIKAALFDLNGRQIACESIRVPMDTPEEGVCNRSMEGIKEANEAVIRRLTEVYGGESIAGIGICGHGKGLYLLDKEKKIFCPGIPSADRRALTYAQTWIADGTWDKVKTRTMQGLMACQPVALLKWLKDQKPEIYEQIGYVLSVKDYVRFCLTGEIYAEYTDISGTNLLDLHTRDYNRELLEAFDILEIADSLPPIRSSTDVCGGVTRAVAERTGLKEGTPVVGGMFDIDACALSSGCCVSGDMCVIAGTWSINEYITDRCDKNAHVAMHSIFCDPQYYLAEESSATSAGNLEWFREQWKINDYGELEEMVSAVDSEDSKLYYLPFLYASNQAPLARGCMVGMSGHHTLGHVARAVYEGVVFCHLTHIKKLFEDFEKPDVVRLAGGVVQSAVWSQMFADAIGLPIELMEDTEMGAKGAAMAAAVGIGLFENYSQAVKSWVKRGKVLQPDMKKHVHYEKKYAAYLAVAEALNPLWDTI